MKRRTKIIVLLFVAALAFSVISASLAMISPSYRIVSDTFQGGGSGGGVSTSASYRLEGSLGGAIQVSSSSASYSACSGFICSGIEFIRNLFLPLLSRQ